MNKGFEDYIEKADIKHKESFKKIIETIDINIPKGFEKGMQFGFPSYFVPLDIYSKGYRDNGSEPLPFVSVGIQKNYISLYHYGVYADEELLKWFKGEYSKRVDTKLNMGKSCIRFTNYKNIPYDLIGELVSKMTVEDWINKVENIKK